MILHIPHSSIYIPPEIKFSKPDISSDLLRVTDWFVDELFSHQNSDRVVFDISRLVCDPERLLENEPMDSFGLGICYTTDSFGAKLREISPEEKSRIVQSYYVPHHKKMTNMVTKTLTWVNQAVIVDCHSFGDDYHPHISSDNVTEFPDFCIGTDPYHTPSHFLPALTDILEFHGVSYAINYPYSGAYVPMQFYQKNQNVWSVMIEVNKRLYMNGAQKSDGWATTKTIVDDLLNTIDSLEKNYEDF